jgi:hypothetical protein
MRLLDEKAGPLLWITMMVMMHREEEEQWVL